MLMHDLFLPAHDLSIGVQTDRCQACARLGYITVATVFRAGERLRTDREGLLAEQQASSQGTSPCFSQLNRVHIIAEEPSQAQSMVGGEVNKRCWDIVSIQPQSERVLQQACSSLPVDIITLDLSTRLPFKLRAGVLQAAAERGVHFEILYAPALRESSARRNVFSNAQALCRALRGKHIIVSSGARSGMEVRAPSDVVNMATFFGLEPAAAQAAISTRCEAVLAKAAMRKLHRASLVLNVKGSFLAQAASHPDRQPETQPVAGADVMQE